MTDVARVPLAASVTPPRAHDFTQLLSLIDDISLLPEKPERPRHKQERLQGDGAFASKDQVR